MAANDRVDVEQVIFIQMANHHLNPREDTYFGGSHGFWREMIMVLSLLNTFTGRSGRK